MYFPYIKLRITSTKIKQNYFKALFQQSALQYSKVCERLVQIRSVQRSLSTRYAYSEV